MGRRSPGNDINRCTMYKSNIQKSKIYRYNYLYIVYVYKCILDILMSYLDVLVSIWSGVTQLWLID